MLFHVKAINGSGAVSRLEIEASNAAEAGTRASGQGYRVLSLAPARSLAFAGSGLRGKFSLPTFSQELLALLDGGLGLIEALNALARKEPPRRGVRVTFPSSETLTTPALRGARITSRSR